MRSSPGRALYATSVVSRAPNWIVAAGCRIWSRATLFVDVGDNTPVESFRGFAAHVPTARAAGRHRKKNRLPVFRPSGSHRIAFPQIRTTPPRCLAFPPRLCYRLEWPSSSCEGLNLVRPMAHSSCRFAFVRCPDIPGLHRWPPQHSRGTIPPAHLRRFAFLESVGSAATRGPVPMSLIQIHERLRR